MMFVKVGYAVTVVAGIALVFLLASLGVPASISIPLALALLLIPGYYHVRRNMVRYTVTDAKLQIDTGLIARTTRNIPLSKVQDVTVSASIPQRLLGHTHGRRRTKDQEQRKQRHPYREHVFHHLGCHLSHARRAARITGPDSSDDPCVEILAKRLAGE